MNRSLPMSYTALISIAKYSILEIIRDRLLLFILSGFFIFFLISIFIGELAITEGVQLQTGILAFSLRLFCVVVISLFVITSMIREFNDKGLALVLSHSVPRATYYLGKYTGFLVLALIISICCFMCISIYAPFLISLSWSLSLFCELLIIIAFSLLCVFSFNSITICFSVSMFFYYLSRSMEVIQLIGRSPILESNAISYKFINYFLDAIAYVLPDLHAFTKTDWLVYYENTEVDIFFVLVQTALYAVFLSSIALFDLYKKEI